MSLRPTRELSAPSSRLDLVLRVGVENAHRPISKPEPTSDPLSDLPPDLFQLVQLALAASGREGCFAIDALCQVNRALRAHCMQWDFWKDLCGLRGFPEPPNPKVLASDAERLAYWRKRFHAYCTGTAVNNVTIRAAVGLLRDNGGTVPDDHPNGPIEGWYTEDVTDMTKLFDPTRDVVSQMEQFPLYKFNHPLPWDTSNVTTLNGTFSRCSAFDQPLNWDTSRVTNMHGTFDGARRFKHPLPWDTSRVTNMSRTFADTDYFNQPLPWDTSRVTTMSGMFSRAYYFNQPLPWDTRNVTTMFAMFAGAKRFNQRLDWDTRSVTTMAYMFHSCEAFNQPVAFDTRNVVSMEDLFWGCKEFNSPVTLDTRNVTNMHNMFSLCRKLAQPVVLSDTSNVTTMERMFFECRRFNHPLAFDTSRVTNMEEMLSGADDFDQPVDHWDTSRVTKMDYMFMYTALSNRDALPKWYWSAVKARRAKNNYHYPYYDQEHVVHIGSVD